MWLLLSFYWASDIFIKSKDGVTGTHIDGVWHTSIVVFGREYFFSQEGINECALVSLN